MDEFFMRLKKNMCNIYSKILAGKWGWCTFLQGMLVIPFYTTCNLLSLCYYTGRSMNKILLVLICCFWSWSVGQWVLRTIFFSFFLSHYFYFYRKQPCTTCYFCNHYTAWLWYTPRPPSSTTTSLAGSYWLALTEPITFSDRWRREAVHREEARARAKHLHSPALGRKYKTKEQWIKICLFTWRVFFYPVCSTFLICFPQINMTVSKNILIYCSQTIFKWIIIWQLKILSFFTVFFFYIKMQMLNFKEMQYVKIF